LHTINDSFLLLRKKIIDIPFRFYLYAGVVGYQMMSIRIGNKKEYRTYALEMPKK